jgi:F-box-like
MSAFSQYERTFVIEPLGQGMIEEETILRAEAERCEGALLNEINRIERAASAYRATLEDRIKVLQDQIAWSKQVQAAEEEVCFIRLKRRFEKMGQEVLGEETIVGPIQTLPTELLSEIFRYYVDSNGSPWHLVKVSRTWKQIAMMTPHLWYHIMVIDDTRPAYPYLVVDGTIQYCPGNIQVCDDSTQLLASIQRSGMLPLNIIINCKGGSTVFLSLLRTLFESTSERIRHLKIGCASFSSPLEDGPPVPTQLPLLASIELPQYIGPWVHALLQIVSSTSTELDNIICRCVISPDLAKHSFWRVIKRFTLLRYSDHQRQLDLIAPKLDQLQNYQYSGICWPHDGTPLSTWPSIRDITLQCAPRYLRFLRMPQLDTLRLSEWLSADPPYHRKEQEVLEIFFPVLTKLELDTPDPSWLSKVHLPRLTELSITYESDMTKISSDFVQNTFPAVEIVELKVWWDNQAKLALSAFPKARTIKISDSANHQSFGLAVLEELTPKPQSIICPHLGRIWLGEPATPVHTPRDELVPLLTRLVNTRQKIGTPLQELVVRWPDGRSQDYA